MGHPINRVSETSPTLMIFVDSPLSSTLGRSAFSRHPGGISIYLHIMSFVSRTYYDRNLYSTRRLLSRIP